MGSVVSIPTALSVVLITGGIIYGFLEKRPPPPAWNAPSFVTGTDSSAANNEKEKKKGKKKKGGKTEGGGAASKEQTTSTPNVVSFPAVVPGAFESAPLTPSEPSITATTTKPKSKKKKTKKSTSTRPAVDGDQQSESSATAPESSVSRPRKSTGDADGAWTRVETKKRVNGNGNGNGNGKGKGSGKGKAPSVTTATSSVAEDSPEETKEQKKDENGNRRTLAEKLLPKARKTGVEDMLQTPDVPPLSRVLRVTPRADEHPAAGFSWGDYEDVEPTSSQASLARGDDRTPAADDVDGKKDAEREDKDGQEEEKEKQEEDDGWVTKSSKRPIRPKPTTTLSTPSPSTQPTKKQRQNATKRASQKSAKALAEAERLSALARHKRELEQLRIKEQAMGGVGGSGGGRRREGAGMVGSVNGRGQLVWD